MQSLLALPYEFQIVVFAGYLAYKIATIGRSVVHRTEDFLLQVLAFGLLGRLLVAALIQAVYALGLAERGFRLSENATLLTIGIGTFLAAVVIAAGWRWKLQAGWIWLMERLDIYRDDHEASVWKSVSFANAQWVYVQLYCNDGRIYEADFDQLPDGLPLNNIAINDDGVAMYVTRFFRPGEDKAVDVDIRVNPEDGRGVVNIDYFPRSTIDRMIVGWRKKPK